MFENVIQQDSVESTSDNCCRAGRHVQLRLQSRNPGPPVGPQQSCFPRERKQRDGAHFSPRPRDLLLPRRIRSRSLRRGVLRSAPPPPPPWLALTPPLSSSLSSALATHFRPLVAATCGADRIWFSDRRDPAEVRRPIGLAHVPTRIGTGRRGLVIELQT